MCGFYGKILKVDLSEEPYSIEAVSDEMVKKYLGGKGLPSYLLYELNPAQVDPLDPTNCLIFATSPVTGSAIWGSCRYGVFTKSPQTGFFSESYAGGKAPEAIDSCGFDAIVIKGQSAAPAVLEIHPEGVHFHEDNIGDGQSEHSSARIFVRKISTRPGEGSMGPVRVGVYPQARELVEYG